ncbi:hypothetical protein [Microbacterium atlanticum]|uniref:hypothetical protein n=1 Tax=Microbacterium atlanticum TaxID=2782168 RepID=UPI001888B067|nr:hypothetical protein [Microbacterium atlanticum]
MLAPSSGIIADDETTVCIERESHQMTWEALVAGLAALIGAVVGGLFAIWAQAREARAQAARDREAREHDRAEARRADGMADCRAILAEFIELRRLTPTIQNDSGAWRRIWTSDRQDALHLRAGLIPDDRTRKAVSRLLEHIDRAPVFAKGSSDWPGAIWELGELVDLLLKKAVQIMNAYVRGDAISDELTDVSFFEGIADRHDEWFNAELRARGAL